MSMLPELNHRSEMAVLSPLQRFSRHVTAPLTVLTRPPRIDAPLWPLAWWQTGLAVVCFVVVMLFIMDFIDAAVIRAVLRLPHWLPWAFDQITGFGKSGWFLFPLGVIFLLLSALSISLAGMSRAVVSMLMVRTGFLFLAIVVPGIFITVVKGVIGRARPMVENGPHPFLFKPFTWHWAFNSLPSGHTTTVFSVLVAFGSLFPRARPLLWAYALAILVSRIMVTAHFPSDVLAGAVIGAGGALLVRRYFALRCLGFTIDANGSVRPLPGPSRRRITAVARKLLAS